jgi:transketolase
MRKEFSNSVEQLAKDDESIVFITGDLGYNALENLQQLMGPRFINAGVAEQNMVGMAAGLAYKGYKVLCYSIAPFIVYRCLEQFRNDVCFHNLPVYLVGNGGGYGYGIMGSSHHAIEDLAILSGMQNTTAWIPGFADEVDPVLREMVYAGKPAYLRLGAGKHSPEGSYRSGSFKVLHYNPDAEITIVALGPLANNAIAALSQIGVSVNVLSVLNLPLKITPQIEEILRKANHILVAEEHISIGGVAQQLSVQLLENNISVRSFKSLHATGYPDKTYGSQSYHQKQSQLDTAGIVKNVSDLISEL